MEPCNSEIMSSSLFGDSNVMLNAVASLLRQHQESREKDQQSMNTPLLVLTSSPGKDSLQANVVLGSAHSKVDSSKTVSSEADEGLLPSLEQVHALATANLVASTQRDIAEQLAQAGADLHPSPAKSASKKRKMERRGQSVEKAKGEKSYTSSKKASESPTPVDEQVEDPLKTKVLICSFEGCKRKFATQNHLKYHEMTHTNNRQHKCPDEICGKTFFTAQRLKVHLLTHTGEKPFKCPHSGCGKTFTTAGNLKNHQRIHTGEQPFVCDHPTCNRRFTEQSSLRKHTRTHSGDKPFECTTCGKKFTQSGSRQQHMIRHRLDEEIIKSYKAAKEEGELFEGGDKARRKSQMENRSNTDSLLQSDGAHVSCSPQVLVLNNSYHGLPTSESIVFSHDLSDHIVTVTTQSGGHGMAVTDSLSLSHGLLNTDGLQDETLQEKSPLVVLSETSMYQHEEAAGDIVYTAGILDHEEVAGADYTTDVVDYHSEMTPSNYSHQEEIASTEVFSDHGINTEINTPKYITGKCVHYASDYSQEKEISTEYLPTEKEFTHPEFIGAEEVTVVAEDYSITSTSSALVKASGENSSDFVQLGSGETEHISPPECAHEIGVTNSNFKERSSRSDLAYISTTLGETEVGNVAEATSPASHHMSAGDTDMYMDPMMECDEEPEKY